MKLEIENPYAPIEELKLPLFAEKGIRVFLKREDLSHPFISGNKWRKLKYHLIDAAEQNKNHLVTFGGAYSNHILAAAAAGAKYQFKTTGIIRGEKVENPVLKLCEWFGMRLLFVSRTDYRNKEALYDYYFGSDPDAYFINEGGASALGERGVQEIFDDLNQMYDDIFCSVGTGSTLKGLIQAVKERNLLTVVHGISVLKGAESLDNLIEPSDRERARIYHQFHEGGYAKTTPELLDFIRHFTAQTGILMDQVYEGKMMKALFHLIESDQIIPGSKILTLHNGGLSGMISLLQ